MRELNQLYLINVVNTNFYKIGVTNNIKKRIQDIQICNPYEIRLILSKRVNHCKQLETFIHNVFIEKHVRGEWFELNIEDIKSLIRYIEESENIEVKKVDAKFRLQKRYKEKQLSPRIHWRTLRTHNFNNDLKKRWHVSYYARKNKTSKFKRFRVSGGINKCKDEKERNIFLLALKAQVLRALQRGYNPFDSNLLITDYCP